MVLTMHEAVHAVPEACSPCMRSAQARQARRSRLGGNRSQIARRRVSAFESIPKSDSDADDALYDAQGRESWKPNR
jgi:hypothetical protein